MMKRFYLNRIKDVTGTSGTGVVAEGVQFNDGRFAMRWLSEFATTVNGDSVEDLIHIHGHDGATELVWID